MEPDLDRQPIPETTAIEPVERELTGHYPIRTPGEKERDLEEISSLYLRGMKPADIASTLAKRHHYDGLSAKTITKELGELRRMWVQSALINYDEAKAREIAHIDELESAAWDAWNRSWGTQTVVVDEDIEDRFGHKDDDPEDLEKKKTTYMRKRGTTTKKEHFGDPRYLDKISWCIDRRCKILGLDEPTRLAISWQQEATKAGISIEDAQEIYRQMSGQFTKVLRDKYIADNSIQIPDELLDEDYEDDGEFDRDIDE